MKICYNHTISHLKTRFKIQIIPKILSTSTQDTQMVHMTWHKGGSPLFKEKHHFSLSFLFQCGMRKGANPSFLLSFWNWERCNPTLTMSWNVFAYFWESNMYFGMRMCLQMKIPKQGLICWMLSWMEIFMEDLKILEGFNLSLLPNQAWRIFNCQKSFLSMFMKAKYFPNNYFL